MNNPIKIFRMNTGDLIISECTYSIGKYSLKYPMYIIFDVNKEGMPYIYFTPIILVSLVETFDTDISEKDIQSFWDASNEIAKEYIHEVKIFVEKYEKSKTDKKFAVMNDVTGSNIVRDHKKLN